MKPILILYFLNTGIFLLPIFRQAQLLARSPHGDPLFYPKLYLFIFHLCILTTMWLAYFKIPEVAWFFFFVAIGIAWLTYRNNHKKIKKTKHDD